MLASWGYSQAVQLLLTSVSHTLWPRQPLSRPHLTTQVLLPGAKAEESLKRVHVPLHRHGRGCIPDCVAGARDVWLFTV